jgi:hypothetical protein
MCIVISNVNFYRVFLFCLKEPMINSIFQKLALNSLAIVVSAASVTAASAASIPGLFNTGVDSSGNVLSPLGGQDPHYLVVETGNNALTMSVLSGDYIANGPNSLWIWEQAGGQPTNVTRTFRTTFNLTGFDPSTASITGQWAADDYLDAIKINGVSIGAITNYPGIENWASFHPFTINSGFTAGLNTLDFVVEDAGGIAGFRINSLSGTAQPVPEPSTILGIGAILGTLPVLRKDKTKRKKKKDGDAEKIS